MQPSVNDGKDVGKYSTHASCLIPNPAQDLLRNPLGREARLVKVYFSDKGYGLYSVLCLTFTVLGWVS